MEIIQVKSANKRLETWPELECYNMFYVAESKLFHVISFLFCNASFKNEWMFSISRSVPKSVWIFYSCEITFKSIKGFIREIGIVQKR